MSGIPSEAPPPYPGTPGSKGGGGGHNRRTSDASGHLIVPNPRSSSPSNSTISSVESDAGSSSGIPGQARASMEDQSRGLPDGWIRRFDASYGAFPTLDFHSLGLETPVLMSMVGEMHRSSLLRRYPSEATEEHLDPSLRRTGIPRFGSIRRHRQEVPRQEAPTQTIRTSSKLP